MSKRMTRYLILYLEAVTVVLVGFAAYQTKATYQRPLNAPMALDVQPSPTVFVKVPAGGSGSTGTQVATQAPTQAPSTCGQSGVMTFLLITNNDWYGGDSGADFIRFVRVDFSNRTVRFIAIPDDIWVSTPHLASINLDNSRLGLVFLRVQQATTGTPSQIDMAATTAVAQVIFDNFSVSADHYIFFDSKYYVQVVDQLGGVDINNPAFITNGKNTFQPGPQHLDGYQSFQYASILPGGVEIVGGWDRIDRQNIVLKALISTLLEPANIVKIPGLIQQFRSNLITDLSPELITNLACMASNVPQEQITTVEIEQDMITGTGPEDSMLADPIKVTQFLQVQLAP